MVTSNIDKSTLKCTHCNKTGHIKSRCFEIVGYSEWWDHNHEQRKKDSKKALATTIVEIKIEDNVIEKAFALVATSDCDGKVLNTFAFIINNTLITDYGAT